MSQRITLEAEAAFLLMVARRILNHQRAAEADGETYHDLSQPGTLQCGAKAKMRFLKTGSGYAPELEVYPQDHKHTPDICEKIAAELLGGPVSQEGTIVGPRKGLIARVYRRKELAT